jgi:MFS transporter, SP family, solute carrier family 2 (myo-inositol transporter), member 13
MLLGFSDPTLTSLSVAATNFLFTVAALLLIDRVGRRRMLLYSVPFMVAGLVLSGYGFHSTELSKTPSSAPEPGSGAQKSAATMILISMTIYVASYAIGLGVVPWMQSELFPLSVRSIGSGVATATNWSANFVVGLTFLPLMDTLKPTWTFVLYAVVCAVGWFAVWLIYPETSGLTLEQSTSLLEDGWGVKR